VTPEPKPLPNDKRPPLPPTRHTGGNDAGAAVHAPPSTSPSVPTPAPDDALTPHERK
jgi:hypothetical protein